MSRRISYLNPSKLTIINSKHSKCLISTNPIHPTNHSNPSTPNQKNSSSTLTKGNESQNKLQRASNLQKEIKNIYLSLTRRTGPSRDPYLIKKYSRKNK